MENTSGAYSEHHKPKKKAGRKAGSANTKTREIANLISQDKGITPLEVMVDNMRFFHQQGTDLMAIFVKTATADENGNTRLTPEVLGLLKQIVSMKTLAQECAKDASPYLHPRLATIEIKQNVINNMPEVPDRYETAEEAAAAYKQFVKMATAAPDHEYEN